MMVRILLSSMQRNNLICIFIYLTFKKKMNKIVCYSTLPECNTYSLIFVHFKQKKSSIILSEVGIFFLSFPLNNTETKGKRISFGHLNKILVVIYRYGISQKMLKLYSFLSRSTHSSCSGIELRTSSTNFGLTESV